MAYVRRPRVLRGATPKTAQRYTAVFDKFTKFLSGKSILRWEQVSKSTLEVYSQWLVDEQYADATVYLELTTLKQTIKWLTTEQHMKQSHAIKLQLRHPVGTTTYCYTDQQVAAMLVRCDAVAELQWLGRIIRGLCYTGLRISELAQLRWSAVDINTGMLRVVDNSREAPRRGLITSRTKTGRSRSLPIHRDLMPVLKDIKRDDDGRVFRAFGGGVIRPDKVRTALIRDVLKPLEERFAGHAGERGFVDGRLHSFRHYFCGKCARDGVAEQTVMLWLGHRDSRMVQHYYQLHDEDAQRQMDKLRSVVDGGAA